MLRGEDAEEIVRSEHLLHERDQRPPRGVRSAEIHVQVVEIDDEHAVGGVGREPEAVAL